VKSVIDGETTLLIGGHYELKGSEVTKYYFAGASRIAVRKYIVPQSSTLTYLAGDHLGSTSLAVNASTGDVVQTRYKPWGEVRFTTENKTLPTRYTYTGQYSDSYINLLWYGSRHYDPELGRFIQPDSIVPDPSNPQAYDRYSYTFNNPVKYVDPSGHKPCWATAQYTCDKRDVTDWLAKALTDTASSEEIAFVTFYLFGEGAKITGAYFAGMAMYIQLVRPGGKYDVKLEIKSQLGRTVKIGNKWYEYSTVGNILFGYYSHAAGFELETIQRGAGWAQQYDYHTKGCPDGPDCDTVLGTEDTFFDSPDDFSAIRFGYNLFASDAAKDGVITPDELTSALDNYVGPYPLDVKPDPGGYMPGGPYSTDAFYQW
jgi:RHS repeat-associated protein